MLRALRSYLHQAFQGEDPDRWYPLLAVHYLTYRCDLRCPYCSDGCGAPYHALSPAVLPAPEVLRLLAIVRRHCDHLVLTGGEPLLHPEVDAVLGGLPALRFDRVILTTSGLHVQPHLPALLRAVDHLVISLDTLDATKADRWYGAGPGTHARVLDQLGQAARWPGRRAEIIISSVVLPGNLTDLREVYRFAQDQGFKFAACPQLQGVKPNPALRGDPAYRDFYDFLIAEKQAGARIQGAIPYLERMRDLEQFRCRPSTMLALDPLGQLFYPCLELGQQAGSLLATPDLQQLRASARARFGPEPRCDNRCHSACALGFAVLLDQPFSALEEAALTVKGWWTRGMRRGTRNEE